MSQDELPVDQRVWDLALGALLGEIGDGIALSDLIHRSIQIDTSHPRISIWEQLELCDTYVTEFSPDILREIPKKGMRRTVQEMSTYVLSNRAERVAEAVVESIGNYAKEMDMYGLSNIDPLVFQREDQALSRIPKMYRIIEEDGDIFHYGLRGAVTHMVVKFDYQGDNYCESTYFWMLWETGETPPEKKQRSK